MTVPVVLDSAGRRRSSATLPGYHAGRAPRNKGPLYPADPPTVEEIVAVMRLTGEHRHGWRLRAMIVVLWRGGLRIHEALALAELDLDPRRGSLLLRNGKGGKRREVGMDEWGWEHLTPMAERTRRAARRAAVLHHRRPHPRAALGQRRGPPRAAPARRPGRRAASLRAASAAPCARARARPRGRGAQHHPAPTRPRQSRHHIHLPARHRPRGDHRRRARAPRPDDVGQRRPPALSNALLTTAGAPRALPLRPDASRRPRLDPQRSRPSSISKGSVTTIDTLALRRRAVSASSGRRGSHSTDPPGPPPRHLRVPGGQWSLPPPKGVRVAGPWRASGRSASPLYRPPR
jgi:Phage integrase family